MESNFNEDVSELSKKELDVRVKRLHQDKQFVTYKIAYWNEQLQQIRKLEKNIVQRSLELRGKCEICGYVRLDTEEPCNIRTLPSGLQVCKKCWNIEICNTKIKNANNFMKG